MGLAQARPNYTSVIGFCDVHVNTESIWEELFPNNNTSFLLCIPLLKCFMIVVDKVSEESEKMVLLDDFNTDLICN